mgnify:FL=1
MGFAGQIFAARVAVGLAVPSPKAMQAQGGLLAKGIQAIYNTTNSVALGQMKDRAAAAGEAAKAAGERVVAAEANVNKILESQLAESLANGQALHQAFGRQLGQQGEELGGAFKALEQLDPDVGGKLTAGITETMNQAQRAEQMVRNWGQMSAAEHKAAHDFAKTAVADAEASIGATMELIDAKKAELDASEAAAQGAKGDAKDKIEADVATLRKEIETAEASVAGKEMNLAAAQDLKKGLGDLATFTRGKLSVAMNEVKEATVADADAKRDARRATFDYEQAQKELSSASVEVAQNLHNLSFTVKQGFNDAVRESVSILTGFYYELNQATSALIDFEAELLNANSVFNVTRDELFETSNVITQFGQQFGLSMQNGATGLYQLASAGLSADESMQILPETLKLSMAVQGDHNTIAKLTTQTLFGFEMEANRAAEVTDKFAHAIQKSLIEYEDLSSAVKFALPFFTSTGQSIDQLLGSLQVLTNRALEAGIAGRGLRQALAEFAEGAEDNSTAFRQMGIDILNADGSMKQLTEIAADFAAVVGEDTVNNTELLTALIQDLNVRGATAFIHLVQASDEFTQAVEDSRNAGGELDEMVRIQNESMRSQIQILKNNVEMIFFMRDANYEGTQFMNAFHEAVVVAVESLSDLLVVQTENGYVLTAFGQQVQDVAVKGIYMLVELMTQATTIIRDMTEAGSLNLELLKLYAIPLKIILDFLTLIGPEGTKFILYLHMLSKILPITSVLQTANAIAQTHAAVATKLQTAAIAEKMGVEITEQAVVNTSILTTTRKWMVDNLSLSTIYSRIAAGYSLITLTVMEIYTQGIATLTSEANLAISQGQNLTLAESIALKITNIGVTLTEIGTMITNTATKIYDALVTAASTIATWALWLAKSALVAVTSFSTITFLAFASVGIIYQTVMYTMTAATWALTSGIYAIPLVGWLLFGIMAVVAGLYILQKEFDVIGIVIDGFRGIFQAIGDKITEVYEDYIFPFIYKFGNEFMALGAVLAFAVAALVDKIKEIGATIVGMIPESFIQLLKDILLFPISFPIAVFQTVFGIVKDLFGSIFDVLHTIYEMIIGRISISQGFHDLKATIAGFVTDTVDRIVKLVDKINILKSAAEAAKDVVGLIPGLATGGYVTGMQSGGTLGQRGPYLVGERGPELFVPNQSGQVLNNRRTEDILARGLEKGAPMQGAQSMQVSELVVGNMSSNRTQIGINPYKKARGMGR